ncbi:MAG: DUF2269 domain-containing protein [Methyloceanibacter sp.]|nr:DUF2269 domain-containing protein [Methyloceanibacter sp.]
MFTYLVLKYLHVIGASVLLGTGVGIAFFMLMAHRSKDPAMIAGVARIVVIADVVFTATAVVLQPVTGVLLVQAVGYTLWEGWIVLSIVLYVMTVAFWLPVVWIQMRIRDLAVAAVARGEPLPPDYQILFRRWFLLGIPAFVSVIAIFWLMIARPQFGSS